MELAIKDCNTDLQITAGADLGGGCRGCAPLPEMTYGFLIQLVFCKKSVVYWCQLRHSLVVHPLLKKILDLPLYW